MLHTYTDFDSFRQLKCVWLLSSPSAVHCFVFSMHSSHSSTSKHLNHPFMDARLTLTCTWQPARWSPPPRPIAENRYGWFIHQCVVTAYKTKSLQKSQHETFHHHERRETLTRSYLRVLKLEQVILKVALNKLQQRKQRDKVTVLSLKFWALKWKSLIFTTCKKKKKPKYRQTHAQHLFLE